MKNFKIDTRGLKRLEKDLVSLNRRGLPHATRNTLNSMAFDAREEWQGEVRKKMTLRNRYTLSSIQVEKARGTDIRSQRSIVGSVAPYMDEQEKGGVVGNSGVGTGKAIPTNAARIGRSHDRLVSRPNKVSSIRLAARRGKSQKQRNAIQIQQVKEGKSKFAYLESANRKGIYRVKGKTRTTITMVQDLSKRKVLIPKNPTMQAAVMRSTLRAPRYYAKELRRQLQMLKSWR